VLVYVEREDELLVFDHRDHADAGTQVPAGGVHPGEDLTEAARREVLEETGVTLDGELRLLGTREHLDGLGRPSLTHFFRVDAPAGLPRSWQHTVTADGSDAGLVFECRFDAAPTLWEDQLLFRLQTRSDSAAATPPGRDGGSDDRGLRNRRWPR
jgi:8-oxo-dGTP pyrophosphatase MutT (NUDIX family)